MNKLKAFQVKPGDWLRCVTYERPLKVKAVTNDEIILKMYKYDKTFRFSIHAFEFSGFTLLDKKLQKRLNSGDHK